MNFYCVTLVAVTLSVVVAVVVVVVVAVIVVVVVNVFSTPNNYHKNPKRTESEANEMIFRLSICV